MTLSAGSEVYNVDTDPVIARGLFFTDSELDQALTGPVAACVRDDPGREDLVKLMDGLADTDFQAGTLQMILADNREPEDYLVGEAIAEAYLVHHRNCEFPWSTRRDEKNPKAFLPGAELVGFQSTDSDEDNTHRFAFCEVKTSAQRKWPPLAVTLGKRCLTNQLSNLKESEPARDSLIKYLGHRAVDAAWKNCYIIAMKKYLANRDEVSIIGALIRDVQPNEDDLKLLSETLANECPASIGIELRALYLPLGSINNLGKRINMQAGATNASN